MPPSKMFAQSEIGCGEHFLCESSFSVRALPLAKAKARAPYAAWVLLSRCGDVKLENCPFCIRHRQPWREHSDTTRFLQT